MSHLTQKPQILSKNPTSSFLQRALQANGIFSGVSGIIMIAGAGSLAAIIGVDAPGILRFIGANLVGFALALFWLARQYPINHKLIQIVIMLDLLWVISSIGLLGSSLLPLTRSGQWIIGLLAMVVGLFTIAQYHGVRQMDRQN